MKKMFFAILCVLFSAFAFSEDMDVKTAAQFATENPAEYARAISSSPVQEYATAAAATLSWQEPQYAGFVMNTWNKTYWTPVFNNSSTKGDPSKPIKSVYYYVAPKYPLDGVYAAQIQMYVYSSTGKLLGVVDRLAATGTRDVSAFNFPSNAKFAISMTINGGGGPMVSNPFIGNTTVAVNY